MRKGIIPVLWLLSITHLLLAQDVKVSALFDSTRILIGDQINFTVIVEQPAGISLKLPSFRDTIVKNIEILRGPQVDSVKLSDGRIRITEKYLVTSFDSGYYEVDPQFVEMKNPDGLNKFFSDYARLEVSKYRIAPADTTAKFYDIVEPYTVPVTIREIIPWALAAILLGAVIWALIFFARRYKKESTGVEEVVNPDPAHIIAFRELEKLREEALWQKGYFKQYYTRLTEILRQYLENRYKVYSLELTTPETLNALLATGFKKDAEYNRLKTVLTAADLVKFARYVPAGEENELHFQNSWGFVDATREIVVFQEQSEAGKVEEGSV